MRGIGLDADEVRTMKRRERRAPGNPEGIVSSSPRLARQRLPWANVTNRKQPQRGCGKFLDGDDSIPHVLLIPLDFVLAQQRAQFVLESDFAMMFLLSGDVLLHLFEIR